MIIMKKEIINIINEIIQENSASKSNEEDVLVFKEIKENDCDDDLLNYGVDSITFIQMIVAFEEHFCIQIPSEMLLFSEMNTVNKIHNVIKSLI